MTERRRVQGYEYEADSDGLIWRIGSAVPLKQIQRKRDGRLVVNLCRDGVMKQRLVHHLIAESFHGPRPPGFDACHWDGNHLNNAADNIYWGTKNQNVADSIRHGTNKEKRKTQCPRGHSLVETNLRPPRRGATRQGVHGEWRECLACHLASKFFWCKRASRPEPSRSSDEFRAKADEFYWQLVT